MSDWTVEEELRGFFGPDSVTWRIHSDPTFSVGGLRALLLQALHPVAMDGVARFSGGFKEEPWPRLIRTATYVDTLTFGTRTEASAQKSSSTSTVRDGFSTAGEWIELSMTSCRAPKREAMSAWTCGSQASSASPWATSSGTPAAASSATRSGSSSIASAMPRSPASELARNRRE